MNARRRSLLALALAAAFVAAPASAFATSHGGAAAHAELRSGDQLAVDQPAQLAVTVDGDNAQPPALALAGTDVHFAGRVSQISVTNGATRNQTTFMYTVVPHHLGALDIPAIRVPTADGVATTEPIHANVVSAPSALSAPSGASVPVAAARNDAAHAFIRFELPTRALYVGQAVPVQVRAYFRGGTGATLEGPPHLDSDAFTLSDLSDKPAQTQVDIGGVPYLQATWSAVLSPAKPSAAKLGVELPVEIAFREAVQRPARDPRSLFDRFATDPFSDPFFNGGGGDPFAGFEDMFDTQPVQRRRLTLRASVGKVTVAELPAAGKPDGFSGAVGSFALTMDPPSGELRVGEPTTVTLHATGTGNFDRLALAGVPESASWKSYPGKTSFEPSGTGKLAGTKTFTQTIVPTRAGTMTLPAIALPYYDPAKRAYVTAETAPLTLQVAAAPGGGAADPGLAAASVRDSSMTPDRVDPGTTQATLAPLYRQRRFWALPSLLALLTTALAGTAWWRRSPRIARVLGARRVDRAVDRQCAQMDRAARRADPVAFFGAARRALQARLGASWHIAPEAVTAADVQARLGEQGAAIRTVFEHADQITYAGDVATPEPLDHWRTVVRDQLAQLEASR